MLKIKAVTKELRSFYGRSQWTLRVWRTTPYHSCFSPELCSPDVFHCYSSFEQLIHHDHCGALKKGRFFLCEVRGRSAIRYDKEGWTEMRLVKEIKLPSKKSLIRFLPKGPVKKAFHQKKFVSYRSIVIELRHLGQLERVLKKFFKEVKSAQNQSSF